MERSAFLARLRDRLASQPRTSSAHPLPRPAGHDLPRLAWPPDGRPLGDVFATALAAHGGRVERVAGEPGLRSLLTSIVHTHGVASAVVTDEPSTDGTRTELARLGVEVRRFTSVAAADADLGVTGAVAAIARTGTVVVDTATGGGRGASLLPDVHLALVTEDVLVDEPADLWRGMTRRYPDALPSQVVLITGPSKSADIEGVLTLGVHGPRAVWVGLVEPPRR